MPYIRPLAEYPDIVAVLKEADERNIATFGGTWHSDFSFLDEPPSLTLLYALELPEVGGDTLWSSQYAAYDTLSTGMKRLLDPLQAVHTGWPHGTHGPDTSVAVSRSVVMARNDPSADREVVHPVVRVHPVTGRRALFVNPVYTQRFEDMTTEESRPLLQHLFDHATTRRAHLSAPLDPWNPRHMGQPMPAPSCDQRLRRQSAPAAPHNSGGRRSGRPGMTTARLSARLWYA